MCGEEDIRRTAWVWHSCPWCHAMNRETARWCAVCAHAAHLPRTRCDCATCQPGLSTYPCCCTADHRCRIAWDFIELAQTARELDATALLHDVRQTYSNHIRRAGLIGEVTEAWPDACRITREDDPRCPSCGNPPDTGP